MTLQKQILVVEDNELNRMMLSEILSGEYQVLEAENGQVALDILKQYKDTISLILLDVRMPVMDGYTFLDRVKEEPELSLIPVIVMTQSDGEEDEVTALSHGATDFVPKPYRPQVILHRVASIIKLRETAAIVNLLQYDRLTGLYSKEFFFQKVREQLGKDPYQEYTIICSDIENFKLYNDNFGVQAGDVLLKEIADWFKQKSGENAICGRFGADRFLCLQKREDRTYFSGTYSSIVSQVVLKWGIYEITDPSISVEQMCDRAVLAADSIKGQYNRSFAVYDDSLRAKLLREKAITDVMVSALREGQFTVYFQPKYRLNEESMVGAEALVRWIHPEWGFISPGEFIPLFEKNGFIPQLDYYIWEKVCLRIKEWKEKGYPLMPVSVNISRADFYQLDIQKCLVELVQKYNIDPACIPLEITESAYAENPGQIIGTVKQLRKLGFIIEMDDFGSGYSSLNMFNQMELDILKLDMKFIQNEMAKPVNQSILHYIVDMCHGMGLSVIAEGVETREQKERLREIGCNFVQGYYFAKPMSAVEFEALLKTQSDLGDKMRMKILQRKESRRKLLIVDENAGYRERVRKTFEEQYQIMEASNAKEAIACITDNESDTISTMILSMTLPENGADVLLKMLRQNPIFWQIPVLATLPGGEAAEKMPLAMETDDFLCKCHPWNDLIRRVNQLVRIAASREREMTLREEASKDYVTGLLNRRGLQAAMDSLKKEDMPLAVYLFDLDEMKMVNDTYGHEAGDRLIQSFADLLRRKTRAKDILCRYGGDEFLVVLRHMSSKEAAIRKGVEICQNFQSSCSVGIALFKTEEKYFSRMIQCADQALYQAKKENKGGYCLWNDMESKCL